MKKQVKIISTLLIVLALLVSLTGVTMAANTTKGGADLSGKIDEIAQGNSSADTSKVVDLGKTVVTIMQTVGIVVAIVVLLVLGIKYMIGSAEEKAEYKKTMLPYVVGAVLIFASTTIVNVVYQLANGLNG